MSSSPENAPPEQKWFQGIPKYAWVVLAVAALGWMFDAMDQHLFNMVRQPSSIEMLKGHVSPDKLEGAAKALGGNLTAIFLVGWACGGFIFGSLGDRLGRAKTMTITILIYAIFTGLSGFARNPMEYGFLRFLTALGVGGEFAAGAALVAETWPDRSRPMALGLMQALSAVGNIMGTTVNFLIGANWRWVYFAGTVPALLVLWIRASVKEPEKWSAAKARTSDTGSYRALFSNPVWRRNAIGGMILAFAGIAGLWGAVFFLPDLIGVALKPMLKGLSDSQAKTEMAHLRSIVSYYQQGGAFCGMLAFAVISERMGRKPTLAVFFLLAFLAVQVTFHYATNLNSACFLAVILGFCALAPFGAYAVTLPELFPTHLRATGVGLCYNGARLVAAAAPFALGNLAMHFELKGDPAHGLRIAAAIVSFVYFIGYIGLALIPETMGKPLPE